MSTIWKEHDLADKRALQNSQPLHVDWLKFSVWLGALVLCATCWGYVLGKLFHK